MDLSPIFNKEDGFRGGGLVMSWGQGGMIESYLPAARYWHLEATFYLEGHDGLGTTYKGMLNAKTDLAVFMIPSSDPYTLHKFHRTN
jgi:hypothetical protein